MAKNFVYTDDEGNCGLATPQSQGDNLCSELTPRESDTETSEILVCDADGMHKSTNIAEVVMGTVEEGTVINGDSITLIGENGPYTATFCQILAALPIV